MFKHADVAKYHWREYERHLAENVWCDATTAFDCLTCGEHFPAGSRAYVYMEHPSGPRAWCAQCGPTAQKSLDANAENHRWNAEFWSQVRG